MTEEDGYRDCLPFGSCGNDTKYLVRNLPGNNICQCVENAVPDGQVKDGNNETYEKCKCKDGYMPSENGTYCIVKPPPDTPNVGPGND